MDFHYVEAINLLRERFGQPHKIIHAYKLCCSCLDQAKVCRVYNPFTTILRHTSEVLNLLDRARTVTGSLLVPPEIRSNGSSNGSSNWTINSLREALNEIIILQAGYHMEVPDQTCSTGSFHAGIKTRAIPPYQKDDKSATDRRS